MCLSCYQEARSIDSADFDTVDAYVLDSVSVESKSASDSVAEDDTDPREKSEDDETDLQDEENADEHLIVPSHDREGLQRQGEVCELVLLTFEW